MGAKVRGPWSPCRAACSSWEIQLHSSVHSVWQIAGARWNLGRRTLSCLITLVEKQHHLGATGRGSFFHRHWCRLSLLAGPMHPLVVQANPAFGLQDVRVVMPSARCRPAVEHCTEEVVASRARRQVAVKRLPEVPHRAELAQVDGLSELHCDFTSRTVRLRAVDVQNQSGRQPKVLHGAGARSNLHALLIGTTVSFRSWAFLLQQVLERDFLWHRLRQPRADLA
mmetsp:Transcript_89602/g.287289  ORF Transcript_89602/g.287289 Transcript_89602/m.287289 type:complete len:225 (-) Transcript_89602:344-1018(-)